MSSYDEAPTNQPGSDDAQSLSARRARLRGSLAKSMPDPYANPGSTVTPPAAAAGATDEEPSQTVEISAVKADTSGSTETKTKELSAAPKSGSAKESKATPANGSASEPHVVAQDISQSNPPIPPPSAPPPTTIARSSLNANLQLRCFSWPACCCCNSSKSRANYRFTGEYRPVHEHLRHESRHSPEEHVGTNRGPRTTGRDDAHSNLLRARFEFEQLDGILIGRSGTNESRGGACPQHRSIDFTSAGQRRFF